jgi:hypothetical protein
MVSHTALPYLSREYWNCIPDELQNELRSFVSEFGAFTPDWFAEVKFHLLKQSGLTLLTRDEFCSVAIYYHLCGKCDTLYMSKQCLLWYRLFDLITTRVVRRAPPCIKIALKNKSIKTVANFMKRANIVSPPFYKARAAPSCKNMQDWGFCSPDEFCQAMRTGKLLEYNSVREQIKMTRKVSDHAMSS